MVKFDNIYNISNKIGIILDTFNPDHVYIEGISYGSVGSAVAVWQQIIGVKVDGEFGTKTRAATLTFQANHGLKVDGEVGKKSWTAGLNELT